MILVSVATWVCTDASQYTHCSVSIDNRQTEALLLLSQCDYLWKRWQTKRRKIYAEILLIKIYLAQDLFWENQCDIEMYN